MKKEYSRKELIHSLVKQIRLNLELAENALRAKNFPSYYGWLDRSYDYCNFLECLGVLSVGNCKLIHSIIQLKFTELECHMYGGALWSVLPY